MKKIISIILSLILMLTPMLTLANSSDNVSIKFNGELLNLDTNAYIKNDYTMVPLRGIFEKIGLATVEWDEATKTVMIVKSEEENLNFIFIQIGQNEAFVNSEPVALDAPAEITNNRTMVPLRFIIENLGANVEWDDKTYTVNITSK